MDKYNYYPLNSNCSIRELEYAQMLNNITDKLLTPVLYAKNNLCLESGCKPATAPWESICGRRYPCDH